MSGHLVSWLTNQVEGEHEESNQYIWRLALLRRHPAKHAGAKLRDKGRKKLFLQLESMQTEVICAASPARSGWPPFALPPPASDASDARAEEQDGGEKCAATCCRVIVCLVHVALSDLLIHD